MGLKLRLSNCRTSHDLAERTSIVERDSQREMSISNEGCARRMFSTAISDWPPARILALSPKRSSNSAAASALSART